MFGLVGMGSPNQNRENRKKKVGALILTALLDLETLFKARSPTVLGDSLLQKDHQRASNHFFFGGGYGKAVG